MITILLQGQLSVAAETATLTLDLPAQTTVSELIISTAAKLPAVARDLILTPDGSLRPSLFIALDDNHLRDTSTLIPPNSKTLTLMPPMAGG